LFLELRGKERITWWRENYAVRRELYRREVCGGEKYLNSKARAFPLSIHIIDRDKIFDS
jgi:hypothetical protein